MYQNFNDYELIYMIKEFDNDNFQILYKKYQPLIYKIVNKYRYVFKKYGYEMDDLMQLGYFALYKSSTFYNENKPSRFINYLKKILNNILLNEIKNNSTNKRIILNNAISYDNNNDNNDFSYLDFYYTNEDPLSYEEQKRKFIFFKNTLDYNNAGIFEMYYNGFTIKEISIMFEDEEKNIIKKIKNIKKKYHKDNINNIID